MEPIASDCNSNATKARDRTFPEAVTLTGAKGSISIASASIVIIGDIDLG